MILGFSLGYGASASRGMPVYISAFAGTCCAYPHRDGRAELNWVVGSIPKWFTCLPMVSNWA